MYTQVLTYIHYKKDKKCDMLTAFQGFVWRSSQLYLKQSDDALGTLVDHYEWRVGVSSLNGCFSDESKILGELCLTAQVVHLVFVHQ